MPKVIRLKSRNKTTEAPPEPMKIKYRPIEAYKDPDAQIAFRIHYDTLEVHTAVDGVLDMAASKDDKLSARIRGAGSPDDLRPDTVRMTLEEVQEQFRTMLETISLEELPRLKGHVFNLGESTKVKIYNIIINS